MERFTICFLVNAYSFLAILLVVEFKCRAVCGRDEPVGRPLREAAKVTLDSFFKEGNILEFKLYRLF